MLEGAIGKTAKSIRSVVRILTAGLVDGYQRRKDKTVSIRFITQEKTSSEIMQIDELVDSYGMLFFKACETLEQSEIEELDKIDLDVFDQPKTQSQRLRNVLYKLWESQGSNGDFKAFYKQKTEQVISHFKEQILL